MDLISPRRDLPALAHVGLWQPASTDEPAQGELLPSICLLLLAVLTLGNWLAS
jgi:hypothetical protein